jgi:S1-C subfamily serine protease
MSSHAVVAECNVSNIAARGLQTGGGCLVSTSVAEPVRRAALLGGVAAVLVGCGGQTEAVTVTRPAPPSTVAPSTVTTAATPVPQSVTASAKKSVLPVVCGSPNTAEVDFEGTGFKVTRGVVTASHVVAACAAGAPIWFQIGFGSASGSVSTDDPTHDLALATYQSPDPSPQPLRAEAARPYVGEPLALIGIPGSLVPIPGFQGWVTVTRGIVLATHQTQQLTSAEGVRETLTDAIRVTTPGVLSGESGGPAIDAAGKVVGVIEGSGPGVATLTPVADLISLH